MGSVMKKDQNPQMEINMTGQKDPKDTIVQSQGAPEQRKCQIGAQNQPFANRPDLDIVLSVKEMSLDQQRQKEQSVFFRDWEI